MRDEIRQRLAPVTNWIPPEIRDQLEIEVWWLVLLVAVLLVLLVVGYLLRGLLRLLFRRRRRGGVWDKGQMQDLDSCPCRAGPPSLTVFNLPGRLRLVIVAPGGKGYVVDPGLVTQLLDRAVPGLGPLIESDQPRIHIWPAQLSTMGFTNSFHRCTPTGQREGTPLRWVLLAGRVAGGSPPLFVGLGIWAESPTTMTRRNLEPEQWLDALRLAAP